MQLAQIGSHLMRAAASLLVAALWLVSCAPATQDDVSEARPHPITVNDEQPASEALFFSSGAWGELPFDKEAKFETLARAVSQGSVEKLEQPLAFQVSQEPAEPELQITGFKAHYQANGQGGTPHLRAGYRVELEVPAGAARGQIVRLRLERSDSGVARTIVLELR